MLGPLRRVGLSGLAVAAALLAVPALTGPSSAEAPDKMSLHLVTMVGPGTAGYRGDFSIEDYKTGLLQRQDAVLADIDATPRARWTTALSGFAVDLTPDEVSRLRDTAGVRLVERDNLRRLAAAGAAPAHQPLAAAAARGGGEGVVVGFVDSGIDSTGPVFADSPALGPEPRGFRGDCDEAPDLCNNKVVAARSFLDGFGADRLRSGSSRSPADDQGHGTMVAALAAGNRATPSGAARRAAKNFSGVAPDARVAVYKACWAAPDPVDDGCSSVDVVTAIDRAVSDGVDVLNLGMSGRKGLDTVDLATLGAAEADIVVVAPAGNEGGTTGHEMPWVTTVGAALTGDSAGMLVLDDGTRLRGTLSPQSSVRAARVVRAREIARPGARVRRAAQCRFNALDAARADGRIVVCERGAGSRLEKSATVQLAGGAGMVLLNGAEDELTADLHSVPTVNLSRSTGRSLKRALARGPVKARLLPSEASEPPVRIARWSARGKARRDVLKPDMVAPGLGLLAPTSTATSRSWDQISGSSAAAAIVSGTAATLRDHRSDWPATRVRSVLATSTEPVRGRLLRTGSGLVDHRAITRAKLVHDLPAHHYREHLNGDRADLNLPSATARSGRTSVITRTLTNVSSADNYWSVRVTGFRRHQVDVFPRAITLRPGEEATIRIRVAGSGAAEDGMVTWRDDRDRLTRIPLRVR